VARFGRHDVVIRQLLIGRHVGRINQLGDQLAQGLMLRSLVLLRQKIRKRDLRCFSPGCRVRFVQNHHAAAAFAAEEPFVAIRAGVKPPPLGGHVEQRAITRKVAGYAGNVTFGPRLPIVANILVVEDEAMILVHAESVLLEAGHDTCTAATLPQAEAIIQSDQPLDLIFTDITLLDELEGGLKVGKLSHGIPVLYTSGKPITRAIRARFAKRSAFVAKPYHDRQIVDAVVALLKPARRRRH
jgi:CheY-like chemotaxis protein